MVINIFPLSKSHIGFVPSDIVLARVTWTNEELSIESIDGALREKIREILTLPVITRVPDGDMENLFSFVYKELSTGSPDFLSEILLRLRAYQLYAIIDN